jgi:hypothetical protein
MSHSRDPENLRREGIDLQKDFDPMRKTEKAPPPKLPWFQKYHEFEKKKQLFPEEVPAF